MKMRCALLAIAVTAGGCSHVAVNAPPPAAAPVASARIDVHGDSLAALAIVGLLMAASAQPVPQAPELAPDRKVLLHDCTQPLPEDGGNLKCR